MSYIEQNADGIEPVSDSWGEIASNAGLYNVISGCALAYDAANMTVDLAAGAIMLNGVPIQIAALANAFTVVSDPTNPRWTWLCLDSAGAAVVVSGDPAATPSVPELGDRVALALLKVQAGQTIAANIATKLDKRIPNPKGLIGYWGTPTSTASTAAFDLVTITKLGFDDSIPVTVPLRILFNYRKQALAANAVSFGFKINGTAITVPVATAGLAWSSATNRAENGYCEFFIGPRSSAAYLGGWYGTFRTAVSADGSAAVAGAFSTFNGGAAIPNAAITSIILTALNDTASNAAEITAVFVYAG